MGNNGAECIKVSGNDEAECPETTVEIKIKTLDSQTYSLRVDKCVPVPALKEQIATVTGVLSEQQRLICRGKVLKDDQLLSAYHVEDGHTLHLVVRQPSSESNPDPQGTSTSSGLGNAQGSPSGPGLFVGTLNLSEHGDGAFPDMSRIVSAVLGSIGIASLGSGSEGIDLNGLGNLRNSLRQQNEQGGLRDQSSSSSDASARQADVPLDSMQLPVITDALTTLSQYLTHLRETSVGGQSGISLASGANGSNRQDSDASSYSTGQGGLPTPESLAEVLQSTRRLIVEQAAECLLQLSRQLENQGNVTDTVERMRIQRLALSSGAFFQHIGALLLELGRTTMTLQMGQTPDNAVVNAGPAVFVSATGTNPIMVQPQPFQAGTGIGAIPLGSVHGSGISGGSVGSGFIPRNIDIRIRTGAYMPSIVNRRDPTGPQTLGQAAPPGAPNVENSTQGTEGNRSSTTRGVEVRVLPIRTLVAAVPASVGRAAASDSARGSMGIFSPVLGRVQHLSSENANNSSAASQGSHQNHPHNVEIGQQSIPDAAGQRNVRLFGVNVNRSSTGEMSSRVEHFLRALFPGEQLQVENVSVHGMNTHSAAGESVATQNTAASQETGAIEDGVFLSNILRHILPIVSETTETVPNIPPTEQVDVAEDRSTQASTQAQDNVEQATSSRRRRDPRLQPSSKRQKRE
ncbi:PREDICTED: large proline-rich protein bag6-B-like isoform X2 [Ipomoea nil]|uniref:large proline-rich protein bag6-B-like isoform X2 n=1 Tax=Ipomoea nil TaxID=35883 RepID=UPI000900E2DC|nr:PREDICTED: large proline-rich protein bag6-B-like isoform X2 [Ipomoea nil]